MNRRDRTNFRSYVIFAPHTFFAIVIAAFVLVGLLFLVEITPQEKSKISEDTTYMLVIGASLLCALIYWIPMALVAYANLRLAKRMNAKLDRQIQASQHQGVDQGAGINSVTSLRDSTP